MWSACAYFHGDELTIRGRRLREAPPDPAGCSTPPTEVMLLRPSSFRPPLSVTRAPTLNPCRLGYARPVIGMNSLLSSASRAPAILPTTPKFSVIAFPSFTRTPGMRLCAVPKKKRSARRNRIRRTSKDPKPIPHIARCLTCGGLKLFHTVCASCGGRFNAFSRK
jgi:ribosomal protein L32